MRTYQRAVKARHLDGWNVAVTFEDGTKGVFDFAPYLGYPCYSSLKSPGVFGSVCADHGTLTWPGDIDIAPEAVWEDSVKSSTPPPPPSSKRARVRRARRRV